MRSTATMRRVRGYRRSGQAGWDRRWPARFRASRRAAPGDRVDVGPRQLHLQLSDVRCTRDLARSSGQRLSCCLHPIGRLMRAHGLKTSPRRRGLPKDDGGRPVIADNLLDRQFTAERWLYMSGSQTGLPKAAKLRPIEVVHWRRSRFCSETAEQTLVLLRYT
jgi:hypothetical protein